MSSEPNQPRNIMKLDNQALAQLIREAHSMAKTQFWALHHSLSGEYNNSDDQLRDIEELARVGNLIAKLVEARNAV